MFGNFGAMDSDPVPEKQKLKKKRKRIRRELPGAIERGALSTHTDNKKVVEDFFSEMLRR